MGSRFIGVLIKFKHMFVPVKNPDTLLFHRPKHLLCVHTTVCKIRHPLDNQNVKFSFRRILHHFPKYAAGLGKIPRLWRIHVKRMESQPNISGAFLLRFPLAVLGTVLPDRMLLLTLFISSIHSCIFLQFLYAVFKLRFIEDTLPLQGEQDGSLVCEKKVLPDLICRLIMQQLRFACHPAPPFP